LNHILRKPKQPPNRRDGGIEILIAPKGVWGGAAVKTTHAPPPTTKSLHRDKLGLDFGGEERKL